MSSLRDRLLKKSTIEDTDMLSDSKVYNNKDVITTPVPALNIAYSGKVDGGYSPGLTIWAGPSKHFKTMFCLISAASYLKKYSDAVVLFYDSEFGSPKEYFKSVGIDPSRVIHSPITSMEQLRTDLSNQLEEIKRGDHVAIVIDSMGNLASTKEIDDAMSGSEKADMTRAKVGKSIFRIVTPHLRLKDIPMFVVQHTYDTMELYSKKVVSGGTGAYYSGDNIFIVGRQQDKDGTEILGYDFIINVEKSRYVKEKSKIPITVHQKGGVKKWTGLFDMAKEGGYIAQHNKQSWGLVDRETGEVLEATKFKRDAIENDGEFWKTLFKTTDFGTWIETKYAVANGDLITEED